MDRYCSMHTEPACFDSKSSLIVKPFYEFKSSKNWEAVLSDDVQLSQRFESVRRTIYSLGFTCVVVMGKERLSNLSVAIKVILKSKLRTSDDLMRARNELVFHSSLDHPNIVPCLGTEETTDSLIIVTPLAHGDLYSLSHQKVLSENNCRKFCVHILNGLNYLHNVKHVVHGDVKPHNILLFRNPVTGLFTAKLCDFGFTELVYSEQYITCKELRGSWGYFAPEQLHKAPFNQAIDMFALGVILYELLCGYEPFYPSDRVRLLTGNAETDSNLLQFDQRYWSHISTNCVEFVKGMLHGDPSKRLTAQQALRSDWIVLGSRSSSVNSNHEEISSSNGVKYDDADIAFDNSSQF